VERGLAANTLESYRRDLRRYELFLTAAGITAIGQVTTGDVAAFLAGLRTGDAGHAPLAASSAGRTMVAVRGLHAFALAQGMAAADPARTVPPPAPPRRLPKAMSVAEIERLLAAAGPGPSVPGSGTRGPGRTGHGGPGDPRALRDRALLEFLYATGARISEALGLDVDELTLGDEPAVLLTGKGGKQRVVPIGRYAAGALDAYLVRARPALAAGAARVRTGAAELPGRAGTAAARTPGAGCRHRTRGMRGSPSPAVFLNARGGRLTRQGAWAVLRGAAQRAGLGAVSPHTLRHSFATHMLDGGADIRVVQELLGHASVTTTQVYTLVTVEHLREVYAASHPRALR